MFPKRKLDESRSGSESQKEQADSEGQQNKRPRVESSPGYEGTPSPPFSAKAGLGSCTNSGGNCGIRIR